MSFSQKSSYGIPLSLREWLVCIFATLTLVFTAWSLGGYKTWALHLLFAGGLGTFLASVVPMPGSWNGYDQQHGNLKNFKRLLLQPFFWAGLCFLVYILIQYFNPSIVQVFGEKSWWVEPMTPPLGNNLPSSVKADYEIMNALRTFVIQASAISLACGILVGIQRRKAALIILWSFVLSGVAMSFVAILQKLSGTDKILWVVEVLNKNPWGTFAYRNQGAAYLILVAIIVGSLYFIYEKKNRFKNNKGGPHFLCFFFIFILFSSVWLALSRSGIILGGILAFIFMILALKESLKNLSIYNIYFYIFFFIIFPFVGILFILNLSDWGLIEHRYNKLKLSLNEIESYDRVLSTKATLDMANDRILYGWGAGSFRYIFPIYQSNYEKIWHSKKHWKRGWEGRKVYNYAHNDWIQFFAEYGIVGCIFLALLFLLLLFYLLSCAKLGLEMCAFLFAGIGIIFLLNLTDFIFSSPAFWLAFLGSVVLIGKFGEIVTQKQIHPDKHYI